ncbi:MAG: SDR family oxidoreductase [Acidimicrobiia bacterium]|nr:SDR family oxidoreductase [Acidimicrobiia bacterium]
MDLDGGLDGSLDARLDASLDASLDGRTAVVTGAGSGIGRASALAFAKAGVSVLVADISADDGHETVQLIEKDGGAAAFERIDVTEPADLNRMFEHATSAFGGVDVLHNNAGIVVGEPHWPESDAALLMRQVTINLGAVVVGTRLAVPYLARRGGGAIVNTASMASVLPLVEEPAYSATKAGVLMFTRTCAPMEGTHGIRVTAVLPGLVRTPLINKSGDGTRQASWVGMAEAFMPWQTPEQVAGVVVDLARHGAGGEWRFVDDVPGPLRELMRMGMP